MPSQSVSRTLLMLVGAAVLVAVGVAAWTVVPGLFAKPVGGPRPPAFRETAAEAGITFRMKFLSNEQGETFKINLYDHGCGLAVGDYDGDGRDDLYFCNQLGRNALYRNKGDGAFEDVTDAAGVGLGDRVCVAATFADYDNDGTQDLYVTSTRGGNVLFRNQGEGKFEDVTQQAGLTHVGHSQSGAFFDYDNDGLLDLFLTNTSRWTTDEFVEATRSYVGLSGIMRSPKEYNVLYRNNGNGTFSDVTEKAGLKGRGWAGDVVAFDYDGDGRLDLFVTSMFGRAQLYRNNADNTFTDVTLKVLGRTPWGGVGARAFDFNNDGRLDLYAVDMHSDMWMGPDFQHSSEAEALASEKKKFRYFNGPRVGQDPSLVAFEKEVARAIDFSHDEVLFGNAFYRNDGGGRFTEISDRAGLETFWPWGVASGDFDNDGRVDVFVPSGMGYPFYYWHNYLLMNEGDGTFRSRAPELGLEPPPRGPVLPDPVAGRPAVRSSRSAVTADFDGDGRLELVTNNFNDQPYYFKNEFPRKDYLALRLRGTRSNRDAIGAVVRVYRGGEVLTRQVHAACGYLAQSSRTLHFGLGDREHVNRVVITWPSGQRQELDAVTVNTLREVIEPNSDKPAPENTK